MRYITTILLSVMLFLSAPAIASDENTQNIGISLDSPLTNPNRLTIKKFLDETTVMYAGIGLVFSDFSTTFSTTSTNPSSTFNNTQNFKGDSYSLAFGARRFLSRDNLSTFMDLELTGFYSESRGSNQSSARSKTNCNTLERLRCWDGKNRKAIQATEC